jgi:ATP-binding cassette subfamily B protein
MTYVDAEINSLIPDFFEAWPFNYLPANVRGEVAAKLRLCAFRPGEVICAHGEMPLAIHCVMKGRVRILGSLANHSPTLTILGKGTVLGWESLLRRVAVGSVRAAIAPSDTEQEILTLALSADEFEALALKYLMPTLAQPLSLLEIYDTLSRFLAKMPTHFSEVKIRETVQYIEREQLAVIQTWHPDSTDADGIPFRLPSNRVWLLSGGATTDIPIGTAIESMNQLKLIRPSLFPVRLLGVDRRFLSSALLTGNINTSQTGDTSNLTQPDTALSGLLNLTESPDEETSTSSAPDSSPPKSYPVRRSQTPEPLEDVVACFDMVCDRMQVPFRPDSLRRWLKERFSGKNAAQANSFDPFDLCTRIAQAIGLNAEMVRFMPTAHGLNRLNTPALIDYRGVLVVLHEVTPTEVILGSPRTGLLRLTPDELSTRLAPSSSTNLRDAACYAVVLERLPQTPTKRFGFNWFIPALSKHRGILIQVLIASMFVQLLGLANPLLVQQIIDNVIVSANAGAMATFGILMILFAVLEGVLTVTRMYLFASTTHRVDLLLGAEIIRHLLRLPLNFFEKRPVGELSARLSELENIRQFLTGTTITAVLDVIFSILYIGVMFLYSISLTFCVLLSVPVVIASTLLVASIQQKLIRAKADHGAKVQSYLIETLGGIFTVKAQHMESLIEATWRERYVRYLASGFTTTTVSTVFSSFSQFLNTMSNLLVLWVGAGLVLKGDLTLGGLIAFRIMTGYVTGPLLRLAGLWQRIQETSLSIELLADIMNSPVEEVARNEANLQMPPIKGRVQYEEISFGFKPGQLQLSNVSLDIPAGSFVAVVGQSGSGKSTLLKLLPRLYVPQSGNIFIDGYDVNKVNLSSLRSQIGIVPQDSVLFEGTIRDNIALFGDLSDDDVIEAATIAEAHAFIMQLPDGYNTPVGERGSSLSGGQRQRVAIARAIARNPRLLIFDEATSALDYETERRVCENLLQRLKGSTCFFITHRLSTITNADWILFMESGVIAEQGSHADLMARRQRYYCLYTQQARE